MNLRYVTSIADTSHQDVFHFVQSNDQLLNKNRSVLKGIEMKKNKMVS
jgi:hypothetical protein